MGKPAEKMKKKKGRPSLLDLEKRSLRLRKLHEQKKKRNPNPNPSTIPNPYARFPIPSAGRRSSRRNPNPEPKSASPAEDGNDSEAAASMEDDEDDDDEPKERRKEKKLKLVLHLPHPNTNSPDLASHASESNGTVPEMRNIDTVGKQTEGKNSAWKATEGLQGTSDLGPTTLLPDKKLLDFILDRLQKKDIYGVFSEPVDPEELPDYHDIIKHPMDFGTVRNKLSSGAYKDLEQFEKDVFLISSNAMRYNAPDTIYFRQARSIHELAKKGFENLRHGGDVGEREPKMVRRGRPPGSGKNSFKRPVGRPPADRASSEFSSEASLANALNGNLSSRSDLLRKGAGQDQQRLAADLSVRPTHYIHSSEAYYALGSEHKSVRNEDFSGSAWKGISNYGRKLPVMDESRRNTYKQCQLSSSMHECSVLEALDGERKVLLPVGFHAEHAYVRSLARFAAHLGPIGWNIAAKRIEKVLPAGIKFGRGWIGEIDAPQSYRPPLSKPSPHPSSTPSNISAPSGGDRRRSEGQEEHPPNNSVGQDRHLTTSLPPSSASISTVPHQRFLDSSVTKGSSPFHPNTTATQPLANGFKAPFVPNLPAHPGTLPRPNAFRGAFGLEAVFAQSHKASTLPSNWSSSSGHEQPSTVAEAEERAPKAEISPTQVTNHVNSLPSSSKGPFPVVTVDSQKPDLALQL